MRCITAWSESGIHLLQTSRSEASRGEIKRWLWLTRHQRRRAVKSGWTTAATAQAVLRVPSLAARCPCWPPIHEGFPSSVLLPDLGISCMTTNTRMNLHAARHEAQENSFKGFNFMETGLADEINMTGRDLLHNQFDGRLLLLIPSINATFELC